MAEANAPECAEYCVAYLDIMGYKGLVDEAVKQKRTREEITRIQRAINWVMKKPEWLGEACIRVFSDCVLVVAGGTKAACFSALECTMHVAGRLAYENLFVRGALTYGLHFDDDVVLFSPALVTAYGMEKSEAFYPRVLVESKFTDHCNAVASTERHRALMSNIWNDHDRRAFLNYLGVISWESAHEESARNLLSGHKRNIEERLRMHADDPAVAAKYGWLASYHNRFCTEALPPDVGKQYLITDASAQQPYRPPSK